MPSRAVWPFFGGIRSNIEDARHKVGKLSCFTMHNCSPCRAPRIRQPYRGFALVGRWGPQTVRSGRKGHGKIRYFWNEGRVFLEREASLARGPVNTIEEVGCRAADRVVITVISSWICQHYRRCGTLDRGLRGNLRKIRILGVWICQHCRRCGSPR